MMNFINIYRRNQLCDAGATLSKRLPLPLPKNRAHITTSPPHRNRCQSTVNHRSSKATNQPTAHTASLLDILGHINRTPNALWQRRRRRRLRRRPSVLAYLRALFALVSLYTLLATCLVWMSDAIQVRIGIITRKRCGGLTVVVPRTPFRRL